MKDNLEKFIQDHREEFDREIPSLKVWAAIDKNLRDEDEEQPTAKPRTMWRYAWIAASIAFLLATGALIGVQMAEDGQAGIASLSDVSTEYAEMENYYQKQIQEKVAILARYDDQTVTEDLKQVDEFMVELQEELKEAPKGNEEKIINAMIDNYQTKINILERVLERIQSTNRENSKSEENETIDI
ncbi:MAG: hypothetical protein AAF985_09105 [Bacteroidota bacterium]